MGPVDRRLLNATMKCLICEGKMSHQERTTFVYTSVENGDALHVIVTDVPAGVCDQCGETVYTPELTDQLLEIIQKARERKPAPQTVEVPLYSLASPG